MKFKIYCREIAVLFLITVTFNYGCGSKDKSSTPSPVASNPSGGQPTSNTGTETGGSSNNPVVSKSATVLNIVGSLALSPSASLVNSSGLFLSAPSTLKCVDAIDGTVYDSQVPVGSDGSFSCENIPQCYDAQSCSKANPVQVKIIDEGSDSVICVATPGASGLVCDVAGCFAAAQAALDDSAKACLTKVNMVAASNVFQQALNKAFQMGEIPLDKYTLESCLALNSEQKLQALKQMTRGSLAEVLIDSLDAQLKKEINKCDATKGEAISLRSVLRDFVSMGFAILQSGQEYAQDLSDPNSIASQLKIIEEEVKKIKIEVANGRDPYGLVESGAINPDTLKYQFTVKCMYSREDGESMGVEIGINESKTDFQACESTYTNAEWGVTLNLNGTSISTKLVYPDINDPQNLHNNGNNGDIPFQYEAFKKIVANPNLTYSLDDIYDIFFTNELGLKFRLRADIESHGSENNERTEYVIDANNVAHAVSSREEMADNAYTPSFNQVFDFIVNEQYPFDFNKLINVKVHRRWNPTGQEYFYVSGKSVNGKEVPVTCDILDANGQPVGLNIVDGVSVNCIATSDTASMKKYFVDTFSNDAFLRIINKNNGQEVRSADRSPVFLQNINVAPGGNMPMCTQANQVSIFKFEKTGEHDNWLDGNAVKTICFDFSTIKNDAEYFAPHFKEVTIGNNSWASYVLAGMKSDNSVVPVCLASSSVSVSSVVGCLKQSTGAFRTCASTSNCFCDWNNGEYMREFSSIVQPADGSVALAECNGQGYYLNYYWEPGSRSSLSDLKVQLIDSSNGRQLDQVNTSYDPSIVSLYIEAAFSECKTSKWCWRKEDIKNIASHTDIPADTSWIKQDIVSFYCHQHIDDATIKVNCDKLHDSKPILLSFAKFSNASSSTGQNVFQVYQNSSYFSHLKQPNPNYNKVFDYKTFTFKYDNYDPFCDDLNNDGKCTFVAGSQGNDVYFSDIWNFNPDYLLYSPVDGLSGYTYDSAHALFPNAPTTWDQSAWETYVNAVFRKIGGPAAMACSNDRTIKLSWENMNFWEDNLWTTARADTCGSDTGYFVVRNILPNKNTYLISQPDRIQAMMRMAFGTLDKRSVDRYEKRFDFIQAMSVFMISMDIPPLVIDSDGSYKPFAPVINGKEILDSWAGYGPTNYNGSLVELINLFIQKGQ